MAITKYDVKILKSERMTDAEDGGGRATGVAVVDNQLNEVFPNISRLDRTLGNVSLRKLFAGVVTENSDNYMGSHAIITRRATDPLVDALLFNTASQTDERDGARLFIEGYVMPSTIADFQFIGDQFAGQLTVTAIQHLNRPIPESGEVFQLIDGASVQFIRAGDVDHEVRTYYDTDNHGNVIEYQRRYMRIQISAPLSHTFPGGQPTITGTTSRNADNKLVTVIRNTQVADSARYYGVQPLQESADSGTLELQVTSIYSQLVPSSIRENPLVDQIAGSRKRYSLAIGNNTSKSLTFTSAAAGQSRSFVGTGVYRGSLTVSFGSAVWADNSRGELRLQSGSSSFDSVTIDYATGTITVFGASPYTGSATASYRPGADAAGQSVTGEIEIALGNRGYAYTLNLSGAKPRPDTLQISFMAMGKWYRVADNGTGQLEGEGTGTIDFATGSVSLTLAALPDVGSSIIYDYIAQDDFNFQYHSGAVTTDPIRILHQLPDQDIDPASLVITAIQNGNPTTLTGDAFGVLSGNIGSGYIYAAEGIVDIRLSETMDVGTSLEFEYSFSDGDDVVMTSLSAGADGSGMSTGTIPGAPFEPGTVSITWDAKRRGTVPVLQKRASSSTVSGTDILGRPTSSTYLDYSGSYVEEFESVKTHKYTVNDDGENGWRIGEKAIDGFINYSTGEFALRTEAAYTSSSYTVAFSVGSQGNLWAPELKSTSTESQETFAGTLLCRAHKVGITYAPRLDSLPAPQLELRLLNNVAGGIVPGSLSFSWAGTTYVDRDGVLYKDIDTKTNAGIAVGRINYTTGVATLSSWSSVPTSGIQLLTCVTASVGFTTSFVTFRTPGAPLRPASLQITAVRVDTGDIITATPDLNGAIAENGIHGSANARTGIVKVRFTDDPDDETGLSDFQVVAAQLRYNAVLQTSMPMDAKLLGLDPVRLPADGRVPIYRQGDLLVIHHTAETPVEPSPGQTVNLSRSEQAEIYVMDSKDNRLDEEQYTADRQLGSITFANPLLLQDNEGEPLTPPLRIMDRVEHMTVCSDAQITGAISINSPLPFDAPAGETQVSSALTWGDLQARLYRWFTQKTWNTGNPNWTDLPEGDQTTAQYNQLNYPPIITNIGAISGRWALVFTSSNSFQVVEEKLGIIASGTTANDTSPINPATGTPYFVIKKEGWGTGWAAGNAVRFNTTACLGPMWCVRTVQPGKGTVDDDHFRLQIRGDAD